MGAYSFYFKSRFCSRFKLKAVDRNTDLVGAYWLRVTGPWWQGRIQDLPRGTDYGERWWGSGRGPLKLKALSIFSYKTGQKG